MANITLNVKSNIDDVLRQMSYVSLEVRDAAIPRALNRVIEMARTQTAREIVADGYNLKISEIKRGISIIKASRGQRGVRMRVPRNTKSLMEYNPLQTSQGVTVRVHGGKKLIKGAFIGQLQNGRYGVYIEDKTAGKQVVRHKKNYKLGSVGGWRAYPVRKLYGPSVGGVFVNEKLQANLDKYVIESLNDRLTHEINRIVR